MKAGMRCWWLVAGLACVPLCNGRAEPPPAGGGEGTRLPGKFVWADLVTDDLAAATGFYRALFGWTFREADGYWIAENGGYPVAGVFQRPRPADRVAKPRWFGYLSVDDVAQAVRAVEAGGGRVVAPRQTVPGRGEQAVFTDPEGALFGAVHMQSGDPADYAADLGDWIWMQLWSGAGNAAAEFYHGVAGYEIHVNPIRGATNDYVLASGGFARATVLTLPPGQTKVRPTWLPFVRVGQVAESVAKAAQLGGTVLVAPRPDLYRGRVAVVADPTGAPVGLMEWDFAVPEGEE